MRRYLYILLTALLLQACGGQDTPPEMPETSGGLTQDQIENGIGPIRSVSLGEIDSTIAELGRDVFTVKCSACHKMNERYVGPALSDVTTRRTGSYVMNMILNPEEMVQNHPEAKQLFAQFMTPMPNQHLTEDEARAVLEFLRTQAGQ